jgi:HTH-type transcriptional regulator, competence development regulator
MNNYGGFLKALREAKKFTLRDVEKQVDVSNAYLSQLESGKIKQPSPNTLYKLAELYEIKYEVLMEKVGYPVSKTDLLNDSNSDSSSTPFGSISVDEELELLDYLKFIRNRKR